MRKNEKKSEKPKEEVKEDIILKVVSFIEENRKSSDLSASMVAYHFDMSISHMSHKFKKQMNQTISDYIAEKKFDYACELLLEPDHSVKEIAFLLGYSHPVSFIYKFKQLYGMTPVEYRMEKLKRGEE